MNKETINCQVVMLPTNSNNSHIGILKRNIDIINPLIYNDVGIFNTSAWSSQHLYFTSNEVIKEDDCVFCYSIHMNNPSHPPDRYINPIRKWNRGNCTACKKIIASTDPSLGLPAIPELFLKKYVAAGGKIDKVKLVTTLTSASYELYGEFQRPDEDNIEETWYKLKLTEANEVVVVESTQYLEVQTPAECLKELECIGQDKELEDAANLSAPGSLYGRFHFKAGAKWQKEQLQLLETSLKGRLHKIKEQSANEAIEFATWVMQQKFDYLVGKSYEKLYKLWQKSKNK
jgi:hypothetical protein